MPETVTIEELPQPFKDKVLGIVGTTSVIEIVRYSMGAPDAADAYAVDALVGRWLVRMHCTLVPGGEPKTEISAVRAADIRKIEFAKVGANVTLDDPVDGTVSWHIPVAVAQALIAQN